MGNKYIYYRLLEDEIHQDIELADGYGIKIHKPRLGCLNLHSRFKPIYLFWYIFTLSKYEIYYVYSEDNKIIHFSHVMPKIFKYAFIQQSNSIHIGPCWTNEDHRGKNIYPAVLSKIRANNTKKNIFIFTEKENIPSQKGIEKVGFKKFDTGDKTKFLGIYRINHD